MQFASRYRVERGIYNLSCLEWGIRKRRLAHSGWWGIPIMKSGSKVWLTLASLLLCAWTIAFAQSSEGPSSKPTVPSAGSAKTVVGCITGYEGRYTLGTSNDTLYLLQGDPDLLKHYNAVLVKVTGTVSEPRPGDSRNNVMSQQPPTLTVSKLKKMADGCN